MNNKRYFSINSIFLTVFFVFISADVVSQEKFTLEKLKAADVIAGEQTWQQYCAFCHSLGKGEADITGPNLYELFKRPVGSKQGFNYSDALKNDQREWGPDLFASYVQNPSETIPGNRMPPVNIPTDKVEPLIAYVMRKTDSVDWDQAKSQTLATGGLDAELRDSRPEFWQMYMENAVKFTLPYEDRTYSFVAYFNEDGTVKGNNRGLTGIWRMRDKRNFCFAIQRIGVHPYEFMHCLNPAKFKQPVFRETINTITPVKGFDDFTIDMSFLKGRPHPLEGDAHPGYWTFLFNNITEYKIKVGKKNVLVEASFNRDKTITSPQGVSGVWETRGRDGKDEEMCYYIENVPGVDGKLSECFALVLMFNPRVGARWPSVFSEGNTYWAETVAPK